MDRRRRRWLAAVEAAHASPEAARDRLPCVLITGILIALLHRRPPGASARSSFGNMASGGFEAVDAQLSDERRSSPRRRPRRRPQTPSPRCSEAARTGHRRDTASRAAAAASPDVGWRAIGRACPASRAPVPTGAARPAITSRRAPRAGGGVKPRTHRRQRRQRRCSRDTERCWGPQVGMQACPTRSAARLIHAVPERHRGRLVQGCSDL